MREYLIDDHVVLDCGNDRGRPDLALPPQSRHLSISMPGRPGLRGPAYAARMKTRLSLCAQVMANGSAPCPIGSVTVVFLTQLVGLCSGGTAT